MFKRRRTTIDGPITSDALRGWLTGEVARRAKCAESQIDTAKPFETYGFDSLAAVQLSGALEKVVKRRLSPAILFEHKTIDGLVEYLVPDPQPQFESGGTR